jgi:hypothetical protein
VNGEKEWKKEKQNLLCDCWDHSCCRHIHVWQRCRKW